MLRNRALLFLVLTGVIAAAGLAFVTHAPNRLLSGQPISLLAAPGSLNVLFLLPGLVLLAGPFLPERRAPQAALAISAAAFLVALCWLAGSHAAALAGISPPAARTAPGAGFWVLFTCAALALIDTTHRLKLSPAASAAWGIAVVAALALLGISGALDQLSLFREYAVRRDVFADALARHVTVVIAALLPAAATGLALGMLARRGSRLGAWLFPALNVVQTIPSIALFGALLVPLAALAAAFPWLAQIGISGIGPAPAIIALVLYSLLPIARNTSAGLAGVSPAALEAARGMGMSARQILWRVELPLALPVLLSGLRVATVQAIGLAAVAALIGAGGLGAIMFQGLFANATDLTLLGALPVIALALAADALFRLLAAWAERRPGD